MNSHFVQLKDNLTSTANLVTSTANLAANILTGGGKATIKVDTSFSTDQLQILHDVDLMIIDCNSFIRSCETSEIPIANAMATHLPGLNKINEWRTSRRNDKLYISYNHILPRISHGEKTLRDIIMAALEKKGQLKDEGKALYCSLSYCIHYNEDSLHQLEIPIDIIRELVNKISDESAYVKCMISFNAEIVKQLKTQEVNQLNFNADDIFSVWERERMNRSNNNYNITSRLLQDVNDDADNKKFNTLLKKTREIKDRLVSTLQCALLQKETFANNLDYCKFSRNALVGMIKKDVDESKMPTPPNEVHASYCNDCVEVFQQCDRCVEDLILYNNQSSEATSRLQTLVELREKIREIADKIGLEEDELESGVNRISDSL